MSVLIRPKRWSDQKPPVAIVNRNHPLALGLANALLLSELGGLAPYDSMQNKAATMTYGPGNPAWGPEGLTFHGLASGTVPEQVNSDPGLGQSSVGTGPMTMLACVKIGANATGAVIGLENGDVATNPSANVRGVQLGIGAATGFSPNTNTGTFLTSLNEDVAWQLPGSAISLPVGQWTQIALVFPGFSATASFYVNGLLKGTTNFGGPAAGEGTPMRFMVGGYFVANGSSSRVFVGQIKYAYRWNRILSPGEMLALAVEPYAFFEPQNQTPPVPFVAAPAGGSGLWLSKSRRSNVTRKVA
jgi:hypothetical protein